MTLHTRWCLVLLFAATLTACGGSGSGSSAPPPVQQGFLKTASAAELEASLKAGLAAIPELQAIPTFAAATQSPAGISTTYTQELNVDEFDSVRYDGEYLYVAPQRFFGCCFILDAAATTPPAPVARSIRVYQTDATTADATPVAEIALEDGVSVQGMYVTGDRLFAITSTSIFGSYGDAWLAPAIWQPQRMGYRVYDIANPAMPSEIVRVEADGTFVDSRRIGNTAYIVSRYTPFVDGLTLPVSTEADRSNNLTVLAGASLADLLPTMTVNDVDSALVDPAACYLPAETEADTGYPVLTIVTTVSLDDPTTISSRCYNGDAYGAYMSEGSLYLTEYAAIGPAGGSELTRIHKFGLAASGISYRGSGEIPGFVWRGGQADFRMSEADDRLRVMTSTFTDDASDRFDHQLHILAEDSATTSLVIEATLPNAARPAEIGKPNEDLFAVRFVGNRVYAVTFERIDPLYVIDLATPGDPAIVGELEVLGFSDFLHPVTDDLLLGIGQGASGDLKLELFDVSIMTQPLSRGSISVGGFGTYSEARHNRHAFTYLAGDIDRFALPVEEFDNGNWLQSGLYEYEIRDKTMPALASLAAVGRKVVSRATDPAPAPYASRARAFINNDAVFFVRDDAVWSSFWGDDTSLSGPF